MCGCGEHHPGISCSELGCNCHPKSFEAKLRALLNSNSAENKSGTPDFVLSEFLAKVLTTFEEAVAERAQFRGEPVEFRPKVAEIKQTPLDIAKQAVVDEIIRNASNDAEKSVTVDDIAVVSFHDTLGVWEAILTELVFQPKTIYRVIKDLPPPSGKACHIYMDVYKLHHGVAVR